MKWFGRSIEYRCDRDSAYAVGGDSMVLGLAALGKGSYFSIFSTHPRTKNRIKKVQAVRRTGQDVSPSIFNTLANGISIFTVVIVMYAAAFSLDWKNLESNYLKEVHYPTKYKFSGIYDGIKDFYYMELKHQ